jgi:hypothetical protein
MIVFFILLQSEISGDAFIQHDSCPGKISDNLGFEYNCLFLYHSQIVLLKRVLCDCRTCINSLSIKRDTF